MPRDPRILVLRGGALGDFILTLPALKALRDLWPKADLTVAGYPHIARLAVTAGYANRVVSLDKAEIARFFAIKPMFTDLQREWISSFDIVINYLHDPDGSLNENLRAAGAEDLLYADPLDLDGHATATFLKPLVSLALFACDPVAVIPGRKPDLHAGPVVLHPGSGSPKKNWPPDRFLDLALRLKRQDTRDLVLLTGEADEALVEPVGTFAREHGFGHRHHPDLGELVSLFHRASRYVGNDSGVTHLAAACGAPTTAIFGPTDPAVWAPLGDHVTVLRAEGGDLAALAVDHVLDAIPGRDD